VVRTVLDLSNNAEKRKSVKSDLLERQKRPTIEAKETYYRGKRDLLWRQKRPTIETKETYYRDKRDLLRSK